MYEVRLLTYYASYAAFYQFSRSHVQMVRVTIRNTTLIQVLVFQKAENIYCGSSSNSSVYETIISAMLSWRLGERIHFLIN